MREPRPAPMPDVRLYVGTWLVLVVLAVGSYVLSGISLGRWSTFAAFCIAAVKGAFVVLFFMHILRTRSSIRLAAAVAVFVFGLLIALSTADTLTRDPAPLLSPPVVSRTGAVD